MFADYSGNIFSKAINKAATQVRVAVQAPVKAVIHKPMDAFNVKKQVKMGINIGKGAEALVSNINPFNANLKKFDQMGIAKGGKVGGLLGRTGELARKNPIATTAIVYSAVLAGKALLAKGGTVAATEGAGGGTIASSADGVVAGTTAAEGGLTTAEVAEGGLTAGEALTYTSEAVGVVGAGGKLVGEMQGPKKPAEIVGMQAAGLFNTDNLPYLIGAALIIGGIVIVRK